MLTSHVLSRGASCAWLASLCRTGVVEVTVYAAGPLLRLEAPHVVTLINHLLQVGAALGWASGAVV